MPSRVPSPGANGEISLTPAPTIFDDAHWRISIGIYNAFDLMVAGPASKELAFVIVIDVRATPRQRHLPFAIRTHRPVVRAKAARRKSLIWHVESPDRRRSERLEICREMGARPHPIYPSLFHRGCGYWDARLHATFRIEGRKLYEAGANQLSRIADVLEATSWARF